MSSSGQADGMGKKKVGVERGGFGRGKLWRGVNGDRGTLGVCTILSFFVSEASRVLKIAKNVKAVGPLQWGPHYAQ